LIPERWLPVPFIVTLKGNIGQRFRDIKVIGVRSVNNASFPEDNILNQFILPDIPSEEVERIGRDLYKFYSKHDIFKESSLSIEKLVNKGMLYFSPLPDSCMGRIILSETDVEIIHNVETEKGIESQKETIHASFGTILLNYNKYAVELDGSLCVTVAHELVHLQFHSRFLKILQLLGEKDIELNSATEPVALDENMTDIQKALCIAEWQANVLATRLAIPKCTVLTVINDIANDPSCRYANDGDRMQACVNAFAKRYNVPSYVAKERLRQLEYDFVDGTCIEVDGDNKKPFYFAPHTLNENETFVIDRAHYERLLQENKDFANLINSGKYVYIGYVICLLDAQYIDAEFTENGVKLALSDYARNHANECCLKFFIHSIALNFCVIKYAEQNPDAIKSELQRAIKNAEKLVSQLPYSVQSSSAIMFIATAIFLYHKKYFPRKTYRNCYFCCVMKLLTEQHSLMQLAKF